MKNLLDLAPIISRSEISLIIQSLGWYRANENDTNTLMGEDFLWYQNLKKAHRMQILLSDREKVIAGLKIRMMRGSGPASDEKRLMKKLTGEEDGQKSPDAEWKAD